MRPLIWKMLGVNASMLCLCCAVHASLFSPLLLIRSVEGVLLIHGNSVPDLCLVEFWDPVELGHGHSPPKTKPVKFLKKLGVPLTAFLNTTGNYSHGTACHVMSSPRFGWSWKCLQLRTVPCCWGFLLVSSRAGACTRHCMKQFAEERWSGQTRGLSIFRDREGACLRDKLSPFFEVSVWSKFSH